MSEAIDAAESEAGIVPGTMAMQLDKGSGHRSQAKRRHGGKKPVQKGV